MASSAQEAGEVETVKYPGPAARPPRVSRSSRRPAVGSAPRIQRRPGRALGTVPLHLGGARTSKPACPRAQRFGVPLPTGAQSIKKEEQ